ncbi:hypothetical protein NX059_004085 [Plenodomus lindquistii]|nr:hypothetical protein NX059_004085 [Plenodomus lindquistii]
MTCHSYIKSGNPYTLQAGYIPELAPLSTVITPAGLNAISTPHGALPLPRNAVPCTYIVQPHAHTQQPGSECNGLVLGANACFVPVCFEQRRLTNRGVHTHTHTHTHTTTHSLARPRPIPPISSVPDPAYLVSLPVHREQRDHRTPALLKYVGY